MLFSRPNYIFPQLLLFSTGLLLKLGRTGEVHAIDVCKAVRAAAWAVLSWKRLFMLYMYVCVAG